MNVNYVFWTLWESDDALCCMNMLVTRLEAQALMWSHSAEAALHILCIYIKTGHNVFLPSFLWGIRNSIKNYVSSVDRLMLDDAVASKCICLVKSIRLRRGKMVFGGGRKVWIRAHVKRVLARISDRWHVCLVNYHDSQRWLIVFLWVSLWLNGKIFTSCDYFRIMH